MTHAFDEARYKQVMGHFCTGVTVITAVHDGTPTGFTAQTFTPLSIDPPLVSFCPSTTVTSWPAISEAGRFAVNILADDQEGLCRIFATKGADKFEGVGWRPGPSTGAPIFDDVLAWVEGEILEKYEGGDHLVVLGRVLGMEVTREASPLLFYRGGFGRFES